MPNSHGELHEDNLPPEINVAEQAFFESVNSVLAVRNVIRKEYRTLEVESTETIRQMRTQLSASLEPARQYNPTFYVNARPENMSSLPNSEFYTAERFIKEELAEYEKNVQRLEQIAEKVFEEPTGISRTIVETATKVLATSKENSNGRGLFLDGGTSHLALQGFYDTKDFNYETDLDFFADCAEEDIETIAGALKNSFEENWATLNPTLPKPNLEIRLHKGKITTVTVIDLNNNVPLASIVSVQKFATEIRNVLKQPEEETSYESEDNLEVFLKHWPTQQMSQTAIHFKPEGQTEIVNAGAPLLNSNKQRLNDSCIKSPETYVSLVEQERLEEADWIKREMLNELTRVYKQVEKGQRLNFQDIYEKTGISLEEVALAEFMQLNPAELQNKKLIERIQNRAIKYLNRALATQNSSLWEQLPAIPMEALLSKTLCEIQGINVRHGTIGSNQIETTYVPTGAKLTGDALENAAIYALLAGSEIRGLQQQGDESESLYWKGKIDPRFRSIRKWEEDAENSDHCLSPTEYFALKTAIASPNERQLSQIANEIEQAWTTLDSTENIFRMSPINKYAMEIDPRFNKELFLEWTKELQELIYKHSKLRELVQLAIKGVDNKTMEQYKTEHGPDILTLVHEIKNSTFWASRDTKGNVINDQTKESTPQPDVVIA